MSINIVEFQDKIIGVVVYKTLEPEIKAKGGELQSLHENAWVLYSNSDLYSNKGIMESLNFRLVFKCNTVFSDTLHILDNEGNIIQTKKAGEEGNLNAAYLPEMKLMIDNIR